MIIFTLLLFGGIALSGFFVYGSIQVLYLGMPVDLVLMIFGIVSGLMYIVLLLLTAKFFEDIQPIFSAGGQLLDTQLLTRNEAGKIGYYIVKDNWIELKAAEIKKQDEEVTKIRCTYKVLATGKEIREDNYIINEDKIFPAIMGMAEFNSEEGFVFRKPAQILFIIIAYILLLIGSIWMLKSRGEMIVPQDSMVEVTNSFNEVTESASVVKTAADEIANSMSNFQI